MLTSPQMMIAGFALTWRRQSGWLKSFPHLHLKRNRVPIRSGLFLCLFVSCNSINCGSGVRWGSPLFCAPPTHPTPNRMPMRSTATTSGFLLRSGLERCNVSKRLVLRPHGNQVHFSKYENFILWKFRTAPGRRYFIWQPPSLFCCLLHTGDRASGLS